MHAHKGNKILNVCVSVYTMRDKKNDIFGTQVSPFRFGITRKGLN